MMLNLLRPVPPAIVITSGFGHRIDNKGNKTFHKGYDFATPVGTPVRAMADGFAYFAGWENVEDKNQGFGLRVWQEAPLADGTYYLWYGHLSQLMVQESDKIAAGQVIGLSGDTGKTWSSKHKGKAPHLHVQARKKNTGDYCEIEFFNDLPFKVV